MSRVSVCELRDSVLSVDELMAAVADSTAGGVVTFVGVVRDHDRAAGSPHDDREVAGLSYTAHPSALEAMRTVADAVAATDGVRAVAAVHRIGDLRVGELAVVTAVSAVHRAEAFDACRRLIDEIKASVPIWKHQLFTDGSDEWVGV